MLTPFEAAGSETWTSIADGEAFLAELAASSPRVSLVNLGSSVEGRVMRGVLVGHPNPNPSGTTALLVASQHGNEPASREAAFAFVRDLAEDNSAEMREYLRKVTWVVMPTCNPDRNAIQRLNAEGMNINNGYPHPPHPEGLAVMRAVVRYAPTLIIDSHEGGISFDEDLAADSASITSADLGIRNLSYAASEAVRDGMLAAGRTFTRFNGSELEHILRNTGALLFGCTVLLESFQSKNNDVTKPGRAISIRTSDQRIAYRSLLRHHMENLDQYVSVVAEARNPGITTRRVTDRVIYQDANGRREVDRIVRMSGGERQEIDLSSVLPSSPPPWGETPWDSNPSNGTGGLRGDYTNVSRTNSAGVTSTYHIYAAHITGDGPHGIIYALHGDGAGWFTNPNSASMESVKAMARARNMILVIPRTPDQTVPYTWWESFSYSTWLADLHSWQAAIHNIERNKVYWFGYSGGAEVLTYNLISAYSSRFTGGGAIMLAGGGKSLTELYAPLSDALKTPGRFLMHWVVGELDNPADGGDDGGFDAVQAAYDGQGYYDWRDVPTKLTIVPGKDHYNIIPDGLSALEEMLG